MRRPKQRRITFRRVFSAWVALSTLGVGMMIFATGARAATVYDAVNMTVNASSIHVIANSNQFPNFRTGAIDNSYAYAHAHVDGSPFAQGRSSPLDTGPFVQLQAATNPIKAFAQPQYADVRFPPSGTKPQEFCFTELAPFLANLAGAPPPQVGPCQRAVGYAQAFARENYAFAQANEAGDTGEQPQVSSSPSPAPSVPLPGAPSTAGTSGSTTSKPVIPMVPVAFTYKPLSPSLVALNNALLAWRARWLTADDAARFPARIAAANTPDGADGMSAIGETIFDPSTGVLTTRGDSRVARVSLGSGAIVLHGVHTLITMINDGTGPKSTMAVEVASAEIGGVPVTIGPDGVSVNGTMVPGLGGAVQQASDQLNAALAQSGWSITAVRPSIVQSTGEKTIDASAVLVKFESPAVQGVTVFTDYWIGQVFADQLGTVGVPLGGGTGGLGGGLGTPGSPGSTQFIPGTQGTSGSPGTLGQQPPSSNAGGLTGLLKTKPLYLLLLYFLWQSIIIGTAASMWWLRMGGKPA